jgi:hypothetical protein
MMNRHVLARSISRPVHELLSAAGRFKARVLASSRRVCTLVTSDSDVIVLAPPAVGDGPLNIVVEAALESAPSDTPALLENGLLRVGRVTVSMQEVEIWEPCPDWVALTARRDHAARGLPRLQAIVDRAAPRESLFWLAQPCLHRGAPVATISGRGGLAARVRNGAEALAAAWEGDQEQAVLGAGRLAGLGRGLTPAGDDFLLGVMLWAWLAHPSPAGFCRALAEVAVPRTTTLSAAWLRAAAGGQFAAPLHQLVAALVGRGDLEAAAGRVLAFGATSGADTLAGLLWIGSARPPPGDCAVRGQSDA